MEALIWYQYLLIGLCMMWSGFARAGIGFGGTLLTLPFLLLVINDPLLFMPALSMQVLLFAGMLGGRQWLRHLLQKQADETDTVDWAYLKKSLLVIIVPKLIGVLGLLTLPPRLMGSIVFAVVSVYACSYILDKPFRSPSPRMDAVFLMIGGYLSGTSLMGAPLFMAVFSSHVAAYRLRDTLFVLWFLLGLIKLAALIAAGVNLQLVHQLWLLPCAMAGHFLGLRFHDHIMKSDPKVYYRLLGWVLLAASAIGLLR